MKVNAIHAPYVLTKPLHHTQRLIKTNEDRSIIVHLLLVENFEFERQVLGFGDGIEVVKPEGLRKKMKDILRNALANYEIN